MFHHEVKTVAYRVDDEVRGLTAGKPSTPPAQIFNTKICLVAVGVTSKHKS